VRGATSGDTVALQAGPLRYVTLNSTRAICKSVSTLYGFAASGHQNVRIWMMIIDDRSLRCLLLTAPLHSPTAMIARRAEHVFHTCA
jgi:hypothetical protein